MALTPAVKKIIDGYENENAGVKSLIYGFFATMKPV